MKSKLSQYISEKFFSVCLVLFLLFTTVYTAFRTENAVWQLWGLHIYGAVAVFYLLLFFLSWFFHRSGLFLRSAGFGYVWRRACSVFCFTLSSSFWSAMLPQWRSSFFIRIRWRSQFPGVSPLESAWALWPTEWFMPGVSKQSVMTCAWEKAKKITA